MQAAETPTDVLGETRKRRRGQAVLQTSDEERQQPELQANSEVSEVPARHARRPVTRAAAKRAEVLQMAAPQCKVPSKRSARKVSKTCQAESGSDCSGSHTPQSDRREARKAKQTTLDNSGGRAGRSLGGLADSDAESSEDARAPCSTIADTRPAAHLEFNGRSFGGIADSDAESSGADSVASRRRTSGRCGMVVGQLGADTDAEVGEWERALENRRAPSERNRPGSAFSTASCSASEIRRLPTTSYLAGQPVFDAAGRVNLHLLLGAYNSLRVNPTLSAEAEARHIGWLARRARDLGLVSDRNLKSGRARRHRRPPAAAARSEPEQLLAEERELRFPTRPGPQRNGEATDSSSLFAEDDVERFMRRKRAMMGLKSLNSTRQTRISSLSSHNVNLRGVRETLTAPNFSFDWNGGAEEDSDEDPGGAGLEVDVPTNHLHRDSRRDLFKDQIHRSVSRIIAQDLAPEEDEEVDEAKEEVDKSKEEVDTAKEEVGGCSASSADEEAPALAGRRRRRARAAADDPEPTVGEKEPPVPQATVTLAPTSSSSTIAEGSEERSAVGGDAAPSAVSSPPIGGVGHSTEEPPASEAAIDHGQEAEGQQAEGCKEGGPPLESEEPRPFKRLRPAVAHRESEGLGDPSRESSMEEEGHSKDISPDSEEDWEDPINGEDVEKGDASDCSWAADQKEGDVGDRRRGLALVRRRQRQAQQHARKLRFELQDAEELGTSAARVVHLGTATMSEEDKRRWKSIVPTACAATPGILGANLGSKARTAIPTRRLLGSRNDDEYGTLYSFAGVGSRKISFMEARSEREGVRSAGA